MNSPEEFVRHNSETSEDPHSSSLDKDRTQLYRVRLDTESWEGLMRSQRETQAFPTDTFRDTFMREVAIERANDILKQFGLNPYILFRPLANGGYSLVARERLRFSREPVLNDEGQLTDVDMVVTEYFPQEENLSTPNEAEF